MLVALLVLNIYWWIIQLKTVTAAMNLRKCSINWEFHFYFCCCDQNTMRKSKLGKKSFISTYCLWLETIIVRSQDRDVKQLVTLHLKSRAEKNEQMHAQYFAFLFVLSLIFPLLHTSGAHVWGNSDALSGLDFLISTSLR